MKRYTLERVELPTQILGSIYSPKPEYDLVCKTMELPWRNNQRDNPKTIENEASCIPYGIYIVEKQDPSFGRDYGYFRFRAIEGRVINKWALDSNGNPMSAILMHRITYVKDLLGCIGIGSRFKDLNKDGVPDMVESGKKLQWMYENLPDVFELEIKKKPTTL
jgi:hypothetical protein